MLLALLLAAADVSTERSVSIWLQPLGLTVAPVAVAVAGGGTYVAVPLGANVAFDAGELALEATFYTYRHGTTSAFTGGLLSLGPVFHTGAQRLNGFFLLPKISFELMHEFSRNVTGFSLLPGIDAGWQHTFGPFYFALLLGISGGWSFADGDSFAGPGLNPTLPTKSRPVFGVNFNLLRLGAAF